MILKLFIIFIVVATILASPKHRTFCQELLFQVFIELTVADRQGHMPCIKCIGLLIFVIVTDSNHRKTNGTRIVNENYVPR